MAHINLLPWREQLREERKKRFLLSLGATFVIALVLVFLGSRYYEYQLETQQARNQLLRNEITKLDVQTKEIAELRNQRKLLIERMKIIKNLEGHRSLITRIFDELVRNLPDGVYFTEVSMKGDTLSIKGVADSNNSISTLMRRLEASDWLEGAALSEVKALDEGALAQTSSFSLTINSVRLEDKTEDAQASGAGVVQK